MERNTVIWFLCVLELIGVTFANKPEDPCTFYMGVNITGGILLGDGSMVHDGLVYPPKLHYDHGNGSDVHRRGCICSVKPCFRKCCPLGLTIKNKACVPSDDPLVLNFKPPIHSMDKVLDDLNATEHFGLVYGNPCVGGHRYVMNPHDPETPDDIAFLQPVS